MSKQCAGAGFSFGAWCVVAALAFAGSALGNGVPAGTPSLSSASLPVRVFYDGSSNVTTAQKLLQAAELAYQSQVNGIGFAAPLHTVADAGIEPGFDVFITTLDPSIAYTFEVQGDNPATAALDCPTMALVNSDALTDQGEIDDAAAHLVNHAALAAALSGEGVTVDAAQWVDDATLTLTVSVASDAAEGARDLTVTNGAGVAVTQPKAFTVTAAAAPPLEKKPGCSAAPPQLSVGLTVLLLALRRRARRRGWGPAA